MNVHPFYLFFIFKIFLNNFLFNRCFFSLCLFLSSILWFFFKIYIFEWEKRINTLIYFTISIIVSNDICYFYHKYPNHNFLWSWLFYITNHFIIEMVLLRFLKLDYEFNILFSYFNTWMKYIAKINTTFWFGIDFEDTILWSFKTFWVVNKHSITQ